MKYIITESKFESVIFDYLDELFDVDNIHYIAPNEYDDDTGEEWEDENRFEFYIGDYSDEETCFRWYSCEYFYGDSPRTHDCPLVSIENEYLNTLRGYFGDAWVEPFKKWFTENFDLPVKSIE